MTSNFGFLRAEWQEVHEAARRAEEEALGDPRGSVFYSRRALDLLVQWLYAADSTLREPHKKDLNARTHAPLFMDLVKPRLVEKMDLIRKRGNRAVHSWGQVTSREAVDLLRELFHIASWLGRTYGRSEQSRPDDALQFRSDLLPKPQGAVVTSTRAQLQRLEAEKAEQDAQLAKEREKSAQYQAENEELRRQVAAVKAARRGRPDLHDYSEQETRRHLIDELLYEAGWPLDRDRDREFRVEGMPSDKGNGRVDYVLWDDDDRPLAVIEAKRVGRDPLSGKHQAKLYANALEKKYDRRPLIYLTNGLEHWFWDDESYPEREVAGFHTKQELNRIMFRRENLRPLETAQIDSTIVNRSYQEQAIKQVAATFETERQRTGLIVMATGAGKTRTTIALVELLQRCNWVQRVLFLADRKALVRQAIKAFKEHLPSSNPVNLLEEKDSDGGVYVSTYPTMMNLIDSEYTGTRRFGPGFFDLVIVDEAHRSVYQRYKALFSHFDSLLVGLTATPRDDIDRDTFNLFGLETGVPTANYSLENAINDGYLVPYRAIDVPLKFVREGIRYDERTEEEKAEWDDQEWSDDGTVPDQVLPPEINRWLFNEDTIDKVLEVVMTNGLKVAGGDRIGKTIIFAQSQPHANYIMTRFSANFPEYKGNFAAVVTHETEYSDSLIDNFGGKEKAPHITISVDMLDTGIDVPEVVNLVFFKTVRSKTKFVQMIGRGTRLCRDLFGPGADKKHFQIFDVCGNFEFFNMHPEVREAGVTPSLQQQLFRRRLEVLQAIDTLNPADDVRQVRSDIADQLNTRVAMMNTKSFLVRPYRHLVERFRERAAWDGLDLQQRHELYEHVSGLPSTAVDSDEYAKRFDNHILRTQLCLLTGDAGFSTLRNTIQEIAEGILAKAGTIEQVREHAELLEEMCGAQWWENVTVAMLEYARRRLRGLVRLIDRTKRRPVYVNFEDELDELTELEPLATTTPVDPERFRSKVREFLREYEHHLPIQRLRRNIALTSSDLEELERILVEQGEFDREQLLAAAGEGGLGLFVRSLLGLDRSAAEAALSSFLQDKTLNARQIEYLRLIVESLTRNGVMSPAQLYESPFTQIAPQGPDVLFPDRHADLEIVLEEVRSSATA
ncbi:DEAD/DEAH box helicase family protein [Saccharopolyspora shandongensis]|uniref:DEAD/DEAH box helicase family protein n=1 Tax=Saccharopolyspora shandongensis TaxID=418495 RepID=UPI0033DFD6B9